LFNTIIGQRLSELTQQANPPFCLRAQIFSSLFAVTELSVRLFSWVTKPVQPAIDSLTKTVQGVKQYGFLQSELDRAKIALLNQTQSAYMEQIKLNHHVLLTDM
jgi:zinc protease